MRHLDYSENIKIVNACVPKNVATGGFKFVSVRKCSASICDCKLLTSESRVYSIVTCGL